MPSFTESQPSGRAGPGSASSYSRPDARSSGLGRTNGTTDGTDGTTGRTDARAGR